MTLLFPKPVKRDRPGQIRKRRIKRDDQKLSRETETFQCSECDRWGKTDPAHFVPRRFQKLRHVVSNVARKCRDCHRKEKLDKVAQRVAIREAYSATAKSRVYPRLAC